MAYSENVFKEIAFGHLHGSWGLNEINIHKDFMDRFHDWFVEQSIVLRPPNLTTQEEFNQFSESFQIEPGLCFGNSQKITLLDENYKYFEGFYYVEGREYHPVVRHAFNTFSHQDGLQLKDYTALSIQPNPTVHFHIGIEIPFKLIQHSLALSNLSVEEFISARRNRSLLRAFFFDSIGEPELRDNPSYFHPEH